MPCFLTECEPTVELQRFGISLVGIYVYHFLWDRILIRPITNALLSRKFCSEKKSEQFRESLWKNVAVGSFFCYGWYVAGTEHWFMNRDAYYEDWPWAAPENLRLYLMIYASFWIQSIDFLLSLTNTYYIVKRKDNMEMLIHHVATLGLMVACYFLDFTRLGICVLMIHDVNDLLLETAKIFVYLEFTVLADIFFGLFALAWYCMRWGFYTYNIIMSVYYNAYDSLVVKIYRDNGAHGYPADTWYMVWVSFLFGLCLLLVLHLYWGYLITVMVFRALTAGKVEKDIRSDSEDDATSTKENRKTTSSPVHTNTTSAGKTGPIKKRRAPKVE